MYGLSTQELDAAASSVDCGHSCTSSGTRVQAAVHADVTSATPGVVQHRTVASKLAFW